MLNQFSDNRHWQKLIWYYCVNSNDVNIFPNEGIGNVVVSKFVINHIVDVGACLHKVICQDTLLSVSTSKQSFRKCCITLALSFYLTSGPSCSKYPSPNKLPWESTRLVFYDFENNYKLIFFIEKKVRSFCKSCKSFSPLFDK